MIVAGAVYLFTYKKPETTQPVTETEGIQTSITSEMPVPGTTTTETIVINETLDLSKYKTPIMIIDQKKTYTAKMKTSAGEIEIVLNAAATPVNTCEELWPWPMPDQIPMAVNSLLCMMTTRCRQTM